MLSWRASYKNKGTLSIYTLEKAFLHPILTL